MLSHTGGNVLEKRILFEQDSRSMSPDKKSMMRLNFKDLNKSDNQIFMTSPGPMLDNSMNRSRKIDQSFQSSFFNKSNDSQLKSELRGVFNKNLGNQKFLKELTDMRKKINEGPVQLSKKGRSSLPLPKLPSEALKNPLILGLQQQMVENIDTYEDNPEFQ